MPHFNVQYITVPQEQTGKRLDNFLLTHIKGVPKSHIYSIIRSGEVRVNSKRTIPSYRLDCTDQIRIPPLRKAAPDLSKPAQSLCSLIDAAVAYEDEELILLNKPAHISVHGGITCKHGIIETLRYVRNEPHLHLVHRLDSATTGCLLIARSLNTLRNIQSSWHKCRKLYRLLVRGHWREKERLMESRLKKIYKNGEHIMDSAGKSAQGRYAATFFSLLGHGKNFSLLQAELLTGRTHQIRLHCSDMGHPILGDYKYAFARPRPTNQEKNLALHAYQLVLPIETNTGKRHFTTPCPSFFDNYSITKYV